MYAWYFTEYYLLKHVKSWNLNDIEPFYWFWVPFSCQGVAITGNLLWFLLCFNRIILSSWCPMVLQYPHLFFSLYSFDFPNCGSLEHYVIPNCQWNLDRNENKFRIYIFGIFCQLVYTTHISRSYWFRLIFVKMRMCMTNCNICAWWLYICV